MQKILAVFVIFFLCSCSHLKTNETAALSAAITPQDIRTHIRFLDADSLGGRNIGTAGAAITARYISDRFKQFGLQPIGDDSTYYQEFTVHIDAPGQTESDSSAGEKRLTRNIAAKIKGAHQPHSYIILSAHYDYHGQADSGSGASGLMELAQYFGAHLPEKSLLFIAFSGEDAGQLGSQYFVDYPLISLRHIQAMINLNDIGGLGHDGLIISGTATSKNWNTLIRQANTDSLTIETTPDNAGQTGFYDEEIPTLNYTTHVSADSTNAEDESHILEHVKRLIIKLDTLRADQLPFKEKP